MAARAADAYVMKPFEAKKILQSIQKHLKEHAEEKCYCEGKVVEFIETRIKALETVDQAAVEKEA